MVSGRLTSAQRHWGSSGGVIGLKVVREATLDTACTSMHHPRLWNLLSLPQSGGINMILSDFERITQSKRQIRLLPWQPWEKWILPSRPSWTTGFSLLTPSFLYMIIPQRIIFLSFSWICNQASYRTCEGAQWKLSVGDHILKGVVCN